MADDSQDNEPLVGFQITHYDGNVQNVEIPIHPVLLKHPAQVEKLVLKCIEIIRHGPNIKSVTIVPRDLEEDRGVNGGR